MVKLGRGDCFAGTAWWRGGTLASEASGLVLGEGETVAVEWVGILEVGMVTTAKGGAGFDGTIVNVF